jgi:hypothetical protein
MVFWPGSHQEKVRPLSRNGSPPAEALELSASALGPPAAVQAKLRRDSSVLTVRVAQPKRCASSIRKNLGLDTGPPSGDKRAQGAAALMLAVRNSFDAPLKVGRVSS